MSYNRKAGLYFGVKHDNVGAEDGFKPATFISSRKNRANGGQQQSTVRSIRDFMDEDDGLLGGVLSMKQDVDAFAGQRGGMGVTPTTSTATGSGSGAGEKGVIGGEGGVGREREYVASIQRLLSNIVSQPTNSIGRKLLRQMGWREGQGIGPRIPLNKLSSTSTSTAIASSDEREAIEAAARATLPKDSLAFLFSGERGAPGEGGENVVTYAPRDNVRPTCLPPSKTDFTGIGYRNTHSLWNHDEEDDDGEGERGKERGRYRVSDLFTTSQQPKRGGNDKKRGRERGSSAAYEEEEEEDDIAFGRERESYYDFEESDSSDDGERERGMAGKGTRGGRAREKEREREREKENKFNEASLVRCPSDNRLPLPGFHVARKTLSSGTQVFQNYTTTLEIPQSFLTRPMHVFSVTSRASESATSAVKWKIDTAESLKKRAAAWGERETEKEGERQKEKESVKEEEIKGEREGEVAKEKEKKKEGEREGVVPVLEGKVFTMLKPHDKERIQRLIETARLKEREKEKDTQIQVEGHMPPPPPLPPAPALALPAAPIAPVIFPAEQEQERESEMKARPMLLPQSMLNNASFAALSAQFKNRFTPATVPAQAPTATEKVSKASSASSSSSSVPVVDSLDSGVRVLKEGLSTAEEYAKLLKEQQQSKQHQQQSSSSTQHGSKQDRTVRRTTTLWEPAALLCKRCNVKAPDMNEAIKLITVLPPTSTNLVSTTSTINVTSNPSVAKANTGASNSTSSMFQRLFGVESEGGGEEVNEEDIEREAMREMEERARREPRLDPIVLRPRPTITAAEVFGDRQRETEMEMEREGEKDEKKIAVVQGPSLPIASSSSSGVRSASFPTVSAVAPVVAPVVAPPSAPAAPTSVTFVPRSQRNSASTTSTTIGSSNRRVIGGGVIGASTTASTSRSHHKPVLSFSMDDDSDDDNGGSKEEEEEKKQGDDSDGNEEAIPTVPLPPSMLGKRETNAATAGAGVGKGKVLRPTAAHSDEESSDEEAKAKRRRLAMMKSTNKQQQRTMMK